MQFIDAMGNVVARDIKTVAAGKATFFDFDFAAFIIDGNRVQLRVLVLATEPPNPSPRSGVVKLVLRPTNEQFITVEVLDTDTGKTTIHVESTLTLIAD